MEIPKRIQNEIEARKADILDLSRRIHADPELAFEEARTSRLLQSILSAEGFIVSPATASLPTSFLAVHNLSADRPRVTFTAEMDALPGLGHACGHNIIAAAGTYAAIVLKSVLGPEIRGTIEVVGTPAEERGSGKVRMLQDGVFKNSDVVLQIHPHSLDTVIGQALARRTLVVEYFGKKAHAAAAPEEGINALDALVLFYHSTMLARAELPPGCLLHGIIEEGGRAPNIIPDYSRGRFSFRADTMPKLEGLYEQLTALAQAAAAATGCRYQVTEPGPGVTTFRRNPALEDLFAGLFEQRGRPNPWKIREAYGSTDLANVSQVVPTIEPLVKASDSPIHTEEFARDAVATSGEQALLDGVFFLACGGYRILTEAGLLDRVRRDFSQGTKAVPDPIE
jgi:amidohydrolase